MNAIDFRSVLTRLRARLIRFRSGTRVRVRGTGHRLAIDGARLFGVTIEIEGAGNELTIDPTARLWGGTIRLTGENGRCVIGDHCKLRGVSLIVEDKASRLVIKRQTSGTGCRILAGEGGLVEIGEDCMMSVGADIRNTDGHSVIDLGTGERVNPAADVRMGDHAWIGLGVQVLKGVHVGEHSISAAGCVVVADVPPNTIVAGIPARPIRTGITWERERFSTTAAVRPANV